jgi:predicted transcriptional regulator
MLVSELREILIHRIQSIDDEDFLNAIKVLTDSKIVDQPYELSDFESQKIANARTQAENGEIVTQEEVFEKVNVWLNE